MNIQHVFMETVMSSIKYLVYIIHDHCPQIYIEIAYCSLFLLSPNYINNATNSLMKQLFTEHSVCFRLWNKVRHLKLCSKITDLVCCM